MTARTNGAGRVGFRILGPVEVSVDADSVSLSVKQRSLLAVLLLNANRVVATDRLAAAVWGESLPAAPDSRLRSVVSDLRRALAGAGTDLVITRRPGYVLQVGEGQLDLDAFTSGVDHAREAATSGRLDVAVARYDEALALWRGAALSGVSSPMIDTHASRLEELRVRALEEHADAMLALGRHADVIAALGLLVAEHSLRERPHAQLMTALYGAGRRSEALDLYHALWRRLVEELGLEPTPELQRLQQQMLTGDPALGPAPRPSGQSPAHPTAPLARQLPAVTARFVGRRDELDQLDALSAGPDRLVLMVGAAGAGKTTLVLHWAHRSADSFPDGQFFVDMRGFHPGVRMSAAEALPLLLTALGVPAEKMPLSLDAQTAIYRSMLAGRRVLVVLDNVADGDQVRPLIPGDPGCLVLATSRDRLSGLVALEGAHRLTLDLLPSADAVELLVHAVGAGRLGDDRAAVLELAELCGRLPLALRIAAARLSDRADLGIRRQVEELAAHGRMTGLRLAGDDTAAVRGAFDLSYQALPSGAGRVFRLLGLVPAPAGLAVAGVAALAGVPVDEVEPHVDALARFHLVKVTPDSRVVCHDLLLEYAAELGAEHDRPEDRDVAVGRLLWSYVDTANRAALVLSGPPRLPVPRDPPPVGASPVELAVQAEARQWIAAEWPNVVAAVHFAAASGRDRLAWQLVHELRPLMRLQAPQTQWQSVAQTALAAAQRAGDLLGEVSMRHSLGTQRWRAAEYQAAIDEFEAAATIARRAGWREAQSVALCNIGVALLGLGQVRPAIRQLEQSLAIDRETGARTGEAAVLTNLASAYEQVGDLARAAQVAELALPLLHETGQHQGAAIAINNLAMVRRQQGHLCDALSALSECLTICRTIGAQHEEADALTTLGLVHRDTGRYEDAATSLTASLDIAQRLSDTRHQIFAHTSLASVQLRQGDLKAAAERLALALDIAHRTSHQRGKVEALLTRSTLDAMLNEHHRAHVHATQALNLARKSGYALAVAEAHSRLATACLGLDDLAVCLAHCRRALTAQRRAGQRLAQARTLLTMGYAHHRSGTARLAQSFWRQAHTLFDEIGAPERDEAAALLR